MAALNSHFFTRQYRFLTTNEINSPVTPEQQQEMFELDESDIWNNSNNVSISQPVPSSARIPKKPSVKRGPVRGTAASMPVSVPDWSKILKEDYIENRRRDSDDDDEYNSGEEWIPPHEFLARTRMASFSVHEGIGRTLKGRDLSRVRNAIWKKTGFED